ncbi:MAG TPA: LysR family transcriptional regulator [Burkholderiaceae bacterium]|nr:LysR family transcriptional regulator [Burkholderiaceae bacterium]
MIDSGVPASDPGWDLYRSFLQVMKTGSLSAAARALATTQPTVGRHVDALERSLGVTLFTRSRGGLAPTPAALELAPHAETMAAAAAALARTATGGAGEIAGVVRLAASATVGAEVLPPILAEFIERHPAIRIELTLGSRNEDLLRRDADVAVRMNRPVQQALVARKLGDLRIGLYAHRRYAQRRGLPRSVEEFASHCGIGYDRMPMPQVRGVPLPRERFGLRCDNELAQLAALRAGIGIGACQAGIARRDPELLPVLADAVRLPLPMWLVMHRDLRDTPRVRALYAHLADRLAAYAASSA